MSKKECCYCKLVLKDIKDQTFDVNNICNYHVFKKNKGYYIFIAHPSKDITMTFQRQVKNNGTYFIEMTSFKGENEPERKCIDLTKEQLSSFREFESDVRRYGSLTTELNEFNLQKLLSIIKVNLNGIR